MLQSMNYLRTKANKMVEKKETPALEVSTVLIISDCIFYIEKNIAIILYALVHKAGKKYQNFIFTHPR